MKGADRVMQLRKSKIEPKSIFVFIGKGPERLPAVDDEFPSVWSDGERPEVADVRWAHRMTVHLHADESVSDDDFDAWVERFAEVEPTVMGICCPGGEVVRWPEAQ